MFFWSTAAQVAMRMETMRKAEAGLVHLARRFGDREPSEYAMELFDTTISSSVLPFKTSSNSCSLTKNQEEDEPLTMHAIRVTQKQQQQNQSEYPLVIVHGYMNGALYFYRNLAALTEYFGTVISVDLLGWGLSSRPSFDRLEDDSVETAEAFFVESLEAWRSENEIEKMNLAGHSMGGYLSVAYTEKYPERVNRLLLLSPAGVPEKTPETEAERKAVFYSSPTRRFVFGLFAGLWEWGYTPGSVMRTIPESRGRNLVDRYVRGRLPAIQDPHEQSVLSEYMYIGSVLPGSGEFGLSRLLEPGAVARKPLLHRVPKLQVKNVSFLYGVHDWMDVRAGLAVREICQTSSDATPKVDVYQVPKAGHLLMLENSKGFNTAVVLAAGGTIDETTMDRSDLPIVPVLSRDEPTRNTNNTNGIQVST